MGLHEARLRRRGAAIEGQDVFEAQPFRDRDGADHAGDGPGLHRRDRIAPCMVERRHAPVGEHRERGSRKSAVSEGALEFVQVSGQLRHRIGIQDCGARPLVFSPLPGDFAPHGQEAVRSGAFHGLRHGLLVARVRVGIHQADRDRLHALLRESLRGLPDLLFRERLQHGPVAEDPLIDLEPQVSRHQGLGLPVPETVHVPPVAPLLLQDVPEPPGRDQSDLRTGPGDDRVDDEGLAVDDRVHGFHPDVTLLKTVPDALRKIGGCGLDLYPGRLSRDRIIGD